MLKSAPLAFALLSLSLTAHGKTLTISTNSSVMLTALPVPLCTSYMYRPDCTADVKVTSDDVRIQDCTFTIYGDNYRERAKVENKSCSAMATAANPSNTGNLYFKVKIDLINSGKLNSAKFAARTTCECLKSINHLVKESENKNYDMSILPALTAEIPDHIKFGEMKISDGPQTQTLPVKVSKGAAVDMEITGSGRFMDTGKYEVANGIIYTLKADGAPAKEIWENAKVEITADPKNASPGPFTHFLTFTLRAR
ncbi:TPA: hypothetical protein MOX26_004394 [Salmonella enterica subsp. enterica serovar Ball]|nr:hypothetical protein [Salmonella enterica subsp. enterica serovar Ball]HCA3488387.1 hypothetical protein [Salmonella enterica subsp. enterica serovar Ball]HCA3563357.1 hypothetical protein [Salmonella enterica subsp. enterica serovar Ball]HCA3582174.1 hypothetical protein [Salmonella enterica subsp. enterica serovar Ball]